MLAVRMGLLANLDWYLVDCFELRSKEMSSNKGDLPYLAAVMS
jgi:hypothetical protein